VDRNKNGDAVSCADDTDASAEWIRFEEAAKQLLNEGYWLRDFRGLLQAAADRIGVPLEQLYP